LQYCLLFLVAQGRVQASAFDLPAEPLSLLDSAKVGYLESDSGRIELAKTHDYVCRAAARRAERDPGNTGKMFLAQPVKFECELGSSLGRSAQRIQRHCQVAVAANGVDELSRSGYFAKKSGIELSRRRRLSRDSRWRRSAEILSKSEELAPRFVYRRSITQVRFVDLAYVSVVEDARYRVGAHA
jgi:hypothetical protein